MLKQGGKNIVEAGRWADALRLSRADVDAFPNRLTDPVPQSPRLVPIGKMLVLLLAIALLPRAVMAWRIPTICTDGTIYVAIAEQHSGGQLNSAEVHSQNLYPLILSAVHGMGLSWETAGKAWGVLCGTLVILPLFGFVRRQFNDRVAAVACLIYAVHPELIEWSPELIRDQTFWLLFTTSLYCLWRATVEVSVPFHLAAAVAVFLCAFTRFEAIFLVIPWAIWSAVRWFYLESGRRRFVASWAMLFVTAVVAVGITGKGSDALGKLSDLRPLVRAQAWLTGTSEVAVPTTVRMTTTRHLRLFFKTVTRGMTELFGALILIGFVLHLRLFLRSDQLPLLLMSLAICGGIWIHLWYSDGEASSRYSLAIVIMGVRAAALCVMRLSNVLADLAARRSLGMRTTMMFAPLVVIIIVGLADAMHTNYDGRLAKAELGRWIQRTYGENSRLAGEDHQLPIVGFYARTGHCAYTPAADVDGWMRQLRATAPDVVLVPQRSFTPTNYRDLLDGARSLGLQLTEPELSIPLQDDTAVLSRVPIRR
jgi:hypothetical protein